MGGLGADAALETVWKSFLAGANLTPGDQVLDIASGAAPIARINAALPAAQRPLFVCIDYASAALQAARRRIGPGALFTTADARRLPFAGGGFAAVVSQFGLEYAGLAAFAAAADQLRPKGTLCAVVHVAGGVIAAESAENARHVRAAFGAGLVKAARATLEASYDAPRRAGSSAYVNKKKDAALERALRDVRSEAAAAPASSARDLIARYASDVEQLAARRFAYGPHDALGWLASVEARLESYCARMNAMLGAAQSAEGMSVIENSLRDRGMAEISIEPLFFRAAEPQGAWRLMAWKSQ